MNRDTHQDPNRTIRPDEGDSADRRRDMPAEGNPAGQVHRKDRIGSTANDNIAEDPQIREQRQE